MQPDMRPGDGVVGRLLPELYVSASDLRYASRPQDLVPYNRFELLRDGGATYPAMLAAIRGAHDTVHMETYILRSDAVGWRFAEALKERAEHGVAVRLIYDSLGALGIDTEYLDSLTRSGVELVEYHPIQPWRKRFRLARRDHRKLLIVDRRMVFTGGHNIGLEYAPVSEGGGGWHDMHVCCEGPIVVAAEELFRATWVRSGGTPYPAVAEIGAMPARPAETALAYLVHNKYLRQRFRFRRAYLRAVRHATRTISIMNAYFVPDRGVRAALRAAARRGVNVRIIVPGRSDLRVVQLASQRIYASLLKAGVKIMEWPERMMHAKTAVIDSVWSIIGSYNLDNVSLRYNLEVGVAVVDRQFGQKMEREFEVDFARCAAIELSSWKRRSFWRKLLEWLAFRFRRWL